MWLRPALWPRSWGRIRLHGLKLTVPFWLKRKFELSGHDPATQRLYYLTSRLNTAGTVIDKWKLRLSEAEAEAGKGTVK